MANPSAPFHPIIYVRGYAMSKGEIDETTADPFCGFNLGSSVYRARPDHEQPAKKFVFESPVIRLRSDYEYTDVFDNGLDIVDPGWDKPISSRSIIIYRYYEKASSLLGQSETPPIEDFAKGLSELILRVRELVCADKKNGVKAADFRCYLVAHSMGGLVCRAFLQNPKLGDDAARACVDKLFTYATPHNGIDMAGQNVPSWLTKNDLSNFNRERMASYLNLKAIYENTDRVDWLPEKAFPSERVFCLIGTNRADYEAALGLSRTFSGHGSDGLVRVANASVWGSNAQGKVSAPCATAYVYRSHSGYFGIVNSEESYQNLIRFLFGELRVDIWADVHEVELPDGVKQQVKKRTEVEALYQFEVLAAPRGKRWYLTRRTAEEDSVACCKHSELVEALDGGVKKIYLSTVFLDSRWRVGGNGEGLAYGLTFGVRVPDYEVDGVLWFKEHFEGGYLFRDSLTIELTPPADEDGEWRVTYDWLDDNSEPSTEILQTKALKGGKLEFVIPFGAEKKTSPRIKGELRFVASAWNAEAVEPV